jgi:hypothetical protein
MNTKNSKVKTTTKTESVKQSAGTTEPVVDVKTANSIVEDKLSDKVITVTQKSGAKGKAKPATETEVVGKQVAGKKVVEKQVAGKKVVEKQVAEKEVTGKKVVEKQVTGKKVVEKQVAGKKVAEKQVAEKTKKGKAVKDEAVEVQEGGDEELEEVEGNKLRYFKLIHNDKIKGRYCGRKPKQAANKAFSSITKEFKKSGEQNGGVNIDINFSIRECTRNSKHKEYKYVGVRQVLDNPVKVEIENVDGTMKQIVYKFHNKLQKAPKA